MLIDFTNCPIFFKGYGGCNGKKLSVLYEDELWMLKFQGKPKHNKGLNYNNSAVCEHLGSSIFTELGIKAQKTKLGVYKVGSEEKIVVACKDFEIEGKKLYDFGMLKNQVLSSQGSGYGTELENILESIKDQKLFDPKKLEEHFWNIFIVDAFIGNWHRHNGNWGYMHCEKTNRVELAPIYDCGSSLYPEADIVLKKTILEDENEKNLRVFLRPMSAIRNKGEKINYFDFISSLENKNCNLALKRITKRINLDKINELVDSIECIEDIEKDFYKYILKERKEKILDYSLNKLKNKEKKRLRDIEV